MLRLLTLAVLTFCGIALGAMAFIYYVTSSPADAGGRVQERVDAAATAGTPAAPLIVLPPPAAAPVYTPPAGVVIESLPPPPPVAREPERRAQELVAFREVRRNTAMDQLNAREALRRQRLGLPPPPPAPEPARPHAGARRRGAEEHATP